MIRKLLMGLTALMSLGAFGQHVPLPAATSLGGRAFNTITLEMSLKPFKENTPAYREAVATELYTQWASLLRHTDTVAVMLWTGDGSEILDYSGKADQPMEWARYMGNPNAPHAVGSGPDSLSLHERAYLYMEHPPAFTYGDLRAIVAVLKSVGKRLTGKVIRVGATFDPGPEFAFSDFKYHRHREILGGNAMGHSTFVSCYSVLKADQHVYAGWPSGIPEGTSFGMFFGRQTQHFLSDLGYDYIWLSNGFGYGVEGWSSTGAIFDGKAFHGEKLEESKTKIAGFWKAFRKECPSFDIQSRGTNLTTGIDLARDAVNLKGIYEGGYHVLPPPNSPWAALDGNFGLEMAGFMSRVSSLPDNRYVYRYYTHDPWWVNSPWLDRYGSEPHDIYLPMSISRIDAAGNVGLPTQLNLLTADNSYGNMPSEVPDEVTPHILKGRYDMPTAPGPYVWVYPFDEYHVWASGNGARLSEMYFGDWFMTQAINFGAAVNTVISTTNFLALPASRTGMFDQSTLVTIVPDAGSVLEKRLIEFVHDGGQLVVYGPADHMGPGFAALLNLRNVAPLEGAFRLEGDFRSAVGMAGYPDSLLHESLYSGGGISTAVSRPDATTRVLARVRQGQEVRDIAWVRTDAAWHGGKVGYIRGTNSARFTGAALLTLHPVQRWFTGGAMLRSLLNEFGVSYLTEIKSPAIKSPVLTVARHENAYYFSGYVPNTTVRHRLKTPLGAPVLTGTDCVLDAGYAAYYFPTAWHKECRLFVEQEKGILSLKEVYSGDRDISRRVTLAGLDHATVRILVPDTVSVSKLRVYNNADYPWQRGRISVQKSSIFPQCFEVHDITGTLSVAW